MKVLKFGGTSVGSAERISSVIEIVSTRLAKEPLTLVFSAFAGVTNALIQLSQIAMAGDDTYRHQLKQLEDRHLEAVRKLINIQNQSGILANVKATINELEDVIHGIFLVRERTPRSLDFVMSFGERLSTYIISEAFKDRGMACEFLDARQVIRTDRHFGHAKVDFEISNKLIRQHFISHQVLQIATGFIGASESGETTTLGRGGSDYTAAILAAALAASEIEIWTDVDGMMTADPRKVKKAFTVGNMTYLEAMELSHFGAKVIFPSTMQPVMANHIPIRIKNTFNPLAAGTCIDKSGNGKDHIIKGISSVDRLSLLSIQGSGMQGVVGVSMRLFGALARANVNVILISQASSEHSICFAVQSDSLAQARESIEEEFALEIQEGEMDEVQIESGLAIVAIVGENMRNNPGTSGRMFSALGKGGVNVRAIAQGSSELNISSVIHEHDVTKALNILHEAFFLSDKRVVNLFLIGTGLIGSELLDMMAVQYDQLSRNNLLEIKTVAVANSSKMFFDADGLDLKSCVSKMKSEGEVMNLSAFLSRMNDLNLSNSIFIDCTSSEEVASRYEEILTSNISIVTPNKKANSGTLETYHKLRNVAFRRGVRFLYETNVGAGLPVINTMNDLILSGDKVMRIEAVLSGTMNYIFSTFSKGMSFTQVVRDARQKGYTEPDPRDDLNGMDVARKVLILARESGIDLELKDVRVESLVPEDCLQATDVREFFERLSHHDQNFEKKRGDAEMKNEKLRFMAVIDSSGARVSLDSVGSDHPFFSLKGSDNIIMMTTERYHDRPMVIRGPGAGASVTAAGVFADIIRIGNYLML